MVARSRDRGQLLLVSAVVIAIILLGIVAVLNGGIYAQNAGSRGGLSEGAAAGTVVGTVRADGPGLLTGTSSATLHRGGAHTPMDVYVAHSRLEANLSRYQGLLTRSLGSNRPATVSLSLVKTTNETTNTGRLKGAYLVDNRSDTAILPATDLTTTPWTLTSNAKRIGHFHVRETDLKGGEFTVKVAGTSSTFTLTLSPPSTGASGRVRVQTTGTGGSDCIVRPGSSGVEVNITGGIVEAAPSDCRFDPPTTLDGPYTVSFTNPSSSTGTFTLATSGSIPNGAFNRRVSDSPYAVPNLTSATIRVNYASPHVSYNTTVPVKPRDTGATSVVSPPRSAVVYTVHQHDTNYLYSIDRYGVPTNYSVSGVTAVGPREVDFNGAGGLDVPYVNESHALLLHDQRGSRVIAENATSAPVAVGRWRGETSVYFANRSTGTLYRVTPGTKPQPVYADGSPIPAKSALGVGDLGSADATPDLAYTNATGVAYVDGNGTHRVGSAAGAGSPRQFGSPGVPVVDAGTVEALDGSGTVEWSATSADAVASPVAAFDWTNDGTTDVVYVDTAGNLAYANSTANAGTELRTVNGNPVAVNKTVGVA